MTEIINTIVDEWDPLGLLPFAPKDEYRDESVLIYKAYLKTQSIHDLAQEIYGIFLKRFGKDVFTQSIDDCVKIAKLIVESLLTEISN